MYFPGAVTVCASSTRPCTKAAVIATSRVGSTSLLDMKSPPAAARPDWQTAPPESLARPVTNPMSEGPRLRSLLDDRSHSVGVDAHDRIAGELVGHHPPVGGASRDDEDVTLGDSELLRTVGPGSHTPHPVFCAGRSPLAIRQPAAQKHGSSALEHVVDLCHVVVNSKRRVGLALEPVHEADANLVPVPGASRPDHVNRHIVVLVGEHLCLVPLNLGGGDEGRGQVVAMVGQVDRLGWL